MHYKTYLREHEETQLHDDPIHSTDEYMYSNARALDLYGQGKRFEIEDNLIYYEIVKVVRDLVDKHFYQHPVQFYIQVANKEVVFTFVIGRVDAKYSYFIETLYMFITTQIYRQFGSFFKVSREDEVIDNDRVVLRIKVKKSEDK